MSNPITLKNILLDPVGACTRGWGENAALDPNGYKAQPYIATIEQLKPLIRLKKDEKQICSRDFGKAKTEGGNLDALKSRMQTVSAELAELELQQRVAAEALLALLMPNETTTPASLPTRFAPHLRPCTETLTVTELEHSDPEKIAAWRRYVDGHPCASLYHDYRWRDVICRSFGHETFYLIARDGAGKVRGLLPLVRLRSRLFGDFAVSVPFFNYGGVLADNPQVATRLLDTAAELARKYDLEHLEIRATTHLNAWPVRTDKVSMIRRLPADGETLDQQIGAKVRAQINRARQTKAQTLIGQMELLDEFYQVFAINMRDLGTPVYGKNFFANILQTFPEQAHLVVVRMEGRPVAAAFLLGYRDMMEIPWASTLRTVNALNINMLLYREVIGFGIKRGFAFFDFGRSTADSGTFRFKKQWGAEPLQNYWHYWLRDGNEMPELKPDSPKFRLAIAAWQRLPVSISKVIGPHIVKYLP